MTPGRYWVEHTKMYEIRAARAYLHCSPFGVGRSCAAERSTKS